MVKIPKRKILKGKDLYSVKEGDIQRIEYMEEPEWLGEAPHRTAEIINQYDLIKRNESMKKAIEKARKIIQKEKTTKVKNIQKKLKIKTKPKA